MPVYADAAGDDLEEAIAAAEAAVRTLPPPRGLRVEIGGENEEMRRSFRGLFFAFGLAVFLVAVYLVLNAVIIGAGLLYLTDHPERVTAWYHQLTTGDWHIEHRPLAGHD